MNHNMRCPFCGVMWHPEHLKSPRHQKNKIFYKYNTQRKHFSANRNGIVVSCNCISSFKVLDNCTAPEIKISVKPDETVEFAYTIRNTNDKTILVVGVALASEKAKFKINKHQFKLGQAPYELEAGDYIDDRIRVTLTTPDIGQYDMPIMFAFRVGGEEVIIIREMIVYVETSNRPHDNLPSPYAVYEINARKIIKTNLKRCEAKLFTTPITCRSIYASGMNPRSDWSLQQIQSSKDIKNIFSTGASERNYVKFFHHLLWYEEIIGRVYLKKYNMSSVNLYTIPSAADGTYRLCVPGLAEKRPSVVPGDMLYIRPHGDDSLMFEGLVLAVEHDHALLHGIDTSFTTDYYGPDKLFDIRFSSSRVAYERMHVAVDNLYNSKQQSKVFPHKRFTIGKARTILKYFNPSVKENKEQCTAIENIVSCSSGTAPYIIHGPPGTGKTVTVVESILQVLNRYPHSRILICTDSNTAADHVAEMLIGYHHFFPNNNKFLIRANSHSRVWETMPLCLRPYSNGQCSNTYNYITIDRFSQYSIVVTTLIHAAKFGRPNNVRTITNLFIDEASQASEPACLIPITGLLKVDGQLVLAGDPFQMGPVVISNDARRLGLGTSLMERLENDVSMYNIKQIDINYMSLLRNNFRSHPDILEIPNDLFYLGQLRAMAPDDPLSYVDILGQQQESRALVFHGVCSQEQSDGRSPSFYNDMEIEVVQQYIKALIHDHGVRPQDIGVVTPYQRQVYRVKQWLDSNNLGTLLEVGTVEAFQGKEKRVILVSTVRANSALFSYDAMYQLGFLVDDKRFNVAITRAKAKVIIIGNPLCLMFDLKWRVFIIKSVHLRTYAGFDFSERMGPPQSDDLAYLKMVPRQHLKYMKNVGIIDSGATSHSSMVEDHEFTAFAVETMVPWSFDTKLLKFHITKRLILASGVYFAQRIMFTMTWKSKLFNSRYIKALIHNHGARPQDIGVVTPYQRQRFNVAITRAKAKVISIGNSPCLMLDYKMSYLLSVHLKTYTGFDFFVNV